MLDAQLQILNPCTAAYLQLQGAAFSDLERTLDAELGVSSCLCPLVVPLLRLVRYLMFLLLPSLILSWLICCFYL